MRQIILFLTLTVAAISGFAAGSSEISDNQKHEDLLAIVKERMSDYNLDSNKSNIYKVETASDSLVFFIDPTPHALWGHEAYVCLIPQNADIDMEPETILVKTVQFPPNQRLLPLEINMENCCELVTKPIESPKAESPRLQTEANTTYVLMIGGGHMPEQHKPFFWNDCSFLYQTLVNKYSIPKSNIYVAMTDGVSPEADMITHDGMLITSPLDLDFDGRPDIRYTATRSDIQLALSEILAKIKEDDQLFLFAIVHGGLDEKGNTYLCLWDNNYLYDYELPEIISPFVEKGVNINIALGACHSGGFIDDLQGIPCVITTACKAEEVTWTADETGHKYSNFVYNWTCAVNQATAWNKYCTSDVNDDGYVTMDEAYWYATVTAGWRKIYPQYYSCPVSTGEELGFNCFPKAVDLYIKDYHADTGKRNDNKHLNSWDSPSVWSRYWSDGEMEHKHADINNGWYNSVINTWIHNRGKKAYTTADKYLHTYWGMASTAFCSNAWNGKEVDYIIGKTGDYNKSVLISEVIQPGDSILISVPCQIPYDAYGQITTDKPVQAINYLSRISDSSEDYVFESDYPYYQDLIYDNKFAQKGVTILERNNKSKSIELLFRNPCVWFSDFQSIEFKPVTPDDEQLFSVAKIYMDLSESYFYNYFTTVGANNVSPSSERKNSIDITKESRFISGFSLDMNQVEKLGFHIVYTKTTQEPETYQFDVIQRSEFGDILGAQRVVIERPVATIVYPPSYEIEMGDGSYLIGVQNDDEDSVAWFDSDMNLLAESDELRVTPTKDSHEYFVAAHNSEGEISITPITLEPSFQIESVEIQSSDSYIAVKISDNIGGREGAIVITSVTGNNASVKIPIDRERDSVSFDKAAVGTGIVNVSCIVDGMITDSINYNLNR